MSKPSSVTPPGAAFLPRHPRLVRAFLGALCFFAWASVMIVEICAFRLMAPEFGNSVFTWTALIGVILVASSVGGWLGGWLADRYPTPDMLGYLMAGAAVLIFLVPPLHGLLGPQLAAGGNLIAGPVFASLLLFAVPGILLGAVSPAAIRYYSQTMKDTHVGASAGVISMLGSLGSFTGTFLSGFFLLSTFGVRSIFFGVAVLLVLLGVACLVLARRGFKPLVPLLAAALVAAGMAQAGRPESEPGVLHEEESFYHRLRVTESGVSPHKRRLLELDSTMEGGMNPDNGALILDYQHYWRLALLNEKLKVQRALFLGAGAFGMPNEVSRELPDAHVEVAEIDPRVIEAGRRFFMLDKHPRVTAHAADARQFLRQQQDKRWDLIFGDAYNGIRSIPTHLTSVEFFRLVHDRLSDQGIYVMNVISAVQGPRAELLSGILASVRAAFPFVEVFHVNGPLSEPQNVILLATKEDWRGLLTDRFYPPGTGAHRLVASRVPTERLPGGGVAFTDNLNPVDSIIARGLMMSR